VHEVLRQILDAARGLDLLDAPVVVDQRLLAREDDPRGGNFLYL